MMQISLKEDQVQGLLWETIETNEDYIRDRAVYGTHPDGTPVYAYRKRILSPKAFLESNARQRNENDGTKWGDDKNGVTMVKVGSIPLNKYYETHMGRFDDQDFKKWWLNREENQAFRTRRGVI